MIHTVTCTLFTHWSSPSVLSTFSYATLGSAEMKDEKSVAPTPHQMALELTAAAAATGPAEALAISSTCTRRAPAISIRIASPNA